MKKFFRKLFQSSNCEKHGVYRNITMITLLWNSCSAKFLWIQHELPMDWDEKRHFKMHFVHKGLCCSWISLKVGISVPVSSSHIQGHLDFKLQPVPECIVTGLFLFFGEKIRLLVHMSFMAEYLSRERKADVCTSLKIPNIASNRCDNYFQEELIKCSLNPWGTLFQWMCSVFVRVLTGFIAVPKKYICSMTTGYSSF